MGKNDKAVVEQSLREALSDTYVLYLKTHSFHWNVEGPFFDSLHKLFEAHYTDMWQAVDEIAERLRAAGAYAPPNSEELMAHSALKEDKKIPAAMDMVKKLAADHETVARRLRKSIPVIQDAGDELSADLFIERAIFHEKAAWMLNATAA